MLFSLTAEPLSRAESRSRLLRFAIVTLPLAGAGLYNRGYQISWLVCPLRSLTGIPCPVCGMTRSIMAAVRGDWLAAIDHHAFGLLLVLILLVAALHCLLELGVQRRIRAFYGRWLGDRRWQLGLLSGLLIYYIVRLHSWAASGELPAAMQASAIGHWLF